MSLFVQPYEAGNARMRDGEFSEANDRYREAWNVYAEVRQGASAAGTVKDFDREHPPAWAFWLLMSGANAQFCMGDFSGCHETGVTAFRLFKGVGLVAGNPFFHLRMGQVSFELDSPEERADPAGQALDNLARALICGGIEIYQGEDNKYLDAITAVLVPPKGFESWHDTSCEGCSMDILNGSHGYLRELFTARYGQPPPYPAADE